MKLDEILQRIPLGDRGARANAYRKLRLIQSRCKHIWPPRIDGQRKTYCELCLCDGWFMEDGRLLRPSFEDEWEADDRLLYALMPDGSLRFIPDAEA